MKGRLNGISTGKMDVLKGTIKYCLVLGASHGDSKRGAADVAKAGTKRPRSEVDFGAASFSKAVGKWENDAGYFFIPSERNTDTAVAEDSFAITFPFSSIDAVCRAVLSGSSVNISKYRWVQHGSSVRVLEIHTNGIEIMAPGESNARDGSEDGVKPWTLADFADIERRGLLKGHQSELYSIIAKVDATSAIVATIPSDPFALVEVYEDIETVQENGCVPLSAVIVLRGQSALAVHVALQPGAMIVLRNVRRQRWHVPKAFEKIASANPALESLRYRAPTHVFVVDDGLSVAWSFDFEKARRQNLCRANLPPLPSTPIPLRAVQGVVTSIRRANIGKAGFVFHSVDIENGDDNSIPGSRCKLYLTYYPIAPNLLWGLRNGALIRAANIYPVSSSISNFQGCAVFAASMRSTIVLLQNASDPVHGAESGEVTNEILTQPPNIEMEALLLPSAKCSPYQFTTKKRSCKEMEWKSRLRSIWFEKSGLAEKEESPSFDIIARNLLEHNKRLEGRLSCDTVTANTKAGQRELNSKRRDPYAEFFFIGCEDNLDDQDSLTLPTVLPLYHIRDACIAYAKALIRKQIQCSESETMLDSSKSSIFEHNVCIKSGWTASRCLQGSALTACLLGDNFEANRDSSARFYACGMADAHLLSIRDGSCKLPVCHASLHTDPSKFKTGLGEQWNLSVGAEAFASIPIHSVVVSSICLGSKRSRLHQPETCLQESNTSKDRESYGDTECLPSLFASETNSISGCCFVCVIDDRIFLSSVHLRCVQDCEVFGSKKDTAKSKTFSMLQLTIRDCLGGKCAPEGLEHSPEDTYVVGRLVRERFSLFEIKRGTFKGCRFTLSHVPLLSLDEKTTSSRFASNLQSIEINMGIKDITKESVKLMKMALQSILADSSSTQGSSTSLFNDGQIGLACAWWKIAENARYCSLLFGGSDECHRPFLSDEWNIILQFPLSSMESTRHGYRRFKCDIGKVFVSTVKSSDVYRSSDNSSAHEFDHIGGEKFLPGMVDRRVQRKHLVRMDTPLESTTGIPTSSFSQLNWDICRDLKEGENISIAPSLARRVTGAQILNINFCRARAQCSQCFASLLDMGGGRKVDDHGGVVGSVKVSNASSHPGETDSFWHIPMHPGHDPAGFLKSSENPNHSKTRTARKAVNLSRPNTLRCPSNCSSDFAVIKWECSGIVDDGTGQATVYAERDAALALIGSSLDVSCVEDGAWLVEDGITFQRSIPPRSFLHNAVQEARMTAYQLARDKPKGKRKIREVDVIKLLTKEAQAEYTLQRHFRLQYRLKPSMDMIFRCKPVYFDNADLLRNTEANVTSARCEQRDEAISSTAVTYSLPPLKLNLVDLCWTYPASSDAWRKIREIKEM